MDGKKRRHLTQMLCIANIGLNLMISINQTAKAYLLAAERCEEQRRLKNNQVQWLLVPAVTNSAFSAELYLKGLLDFEGVSKKGHKLEELFNEISDKLKNQIISLTSLNSQDFQNNLKKISNAFVEWRYLYEKDDIQIIWCFLQKFSNAVKLISEKYTNIA